jgi:hypothetical protein
MVPVMRKIDYTALIYPTAHDKVAGFRARMKGSGSFWGTTMLANQARPAIALILIAIAAALQLTGLINAIRTTAAGASTEYLLFTIATLVALTVFTVISVKKLRAESSWETWYRLDGFARANGLIFSPSSAPVSAPASTAARNPGSPDRPGYPGAIFGLGTKQRRLNHLFSITGREIDMGNYRYVTTSGKNSTTHNWGYLAVRLERQLPHMVLDSRANNGVFGGTRLPIFFSQNQSLSLEGDFNTHFTLYCPRAYERDALYVFTPDLMALLIDEAAPFDVEIIDDWMFVYSPTPFAPTDPQVYQRLFRIIDTVGEKTLSQTERYADERIGDPAVNLVAPAGQRLRSGASTSTIVVAVVLAAVWLFITLSGTFR